MRSLMGILLAGTHLHYWGFDSMCLDYNTETVDLKIRILNKKHLCQGDQADSA